MKVIPPTAGPARLRRTLAALGLSMLAGVAAAQAAAGIKVLQPWSRSTVQGQSAGGGFMVISNEGATPDRLTSVRSPAAERVELHAMTMEGDVMRMRPLQAIDLPAGGKIELKPGGMHLMLIGLKAPLKTGQSVPLTLNFEKAGAVSVELKVQSGMPAGQHVHH